MMKQLAISLALFFILVPFQNVNAQKNWHEFCTTVSTLAKSVMSTRQAGGAMSDMMQIAKGHDLNEQMVIAAFEKPRFETEKIQQRAISEFADEWYLKCAKELKK